MPFGPGIPLGPAIDDPRKPGSPGGPGRPNPGPPAFPFSPGEPLGPAEVENTWDNVGSR